MTSINKRRGVYLSQKGLEGLALIANNVSTGGPAKVLGIPEAEWDAEDKRRAECVEAGIRWVRAQELRRTGGKGFPPHPVVKGGAK